MQRISLWLAAILMFASAATAQVLSPREVPDILGQRLQLKHLHELDKMAADLRALQLPYHFYFSRKLDIDETVQRQTDQRSIQFVKREGLSLLELTGNYYIAFPGTIERDARARRIFREVVLPMLKIEVTHFNNDDSFGGFAFEVAYHVNRKVLGIDSEGVENFALILPRRAGERLAHAKSPEDEQAALLDGIAYVDAQPFLLWLGDGKPSEEEQARILKDSLDRQSGAEDETASLARDSHSRTVSEKLLPTPEWLKPKPVTPADIDNLNAQYHAVGETLVKELDTEAHFVPYALPTFIAFKDAAYLQLSMKTTVEGSQSDTQYRRAALAFDNHIAHLIRPVLKRLPAESRLTGVNFSTTVKTADTSDSVEFLIPVATMDCFARYECSGQQVISNSVVLINGERASLDLERAEARR